MFEVEDSRSGEDALRLQVLERFGLCEKLPNRFFLGGSYPAIAISSVERMESLFI